VTDAIELRSLRFDALVGVLADEQVHPQPIEIDLDLHADLTQAGASDDLADTVDYGAVCTAIERVVDAGHVALLERMAQCMADAVLAVDPRVSSVSLSVRKLRPPVPQELGTSGVRISRSR
jgi:dihydroneopterin aldolase